MTFQERNEKTNKKGVFSIIIAVFAKTSVQYGETSVQYGVCYNNSDFNIMRTT